MISRTTVADVIVTTLCLLVVAAIVIQVKESKVSANNELLKEIRAKIEVNTQSLDDMRERLRVLEEGK